ncbi:MAG: thymidine phosphorylase [Ruminococcaceae bacterium]|nr:thymidine phosphorylase [Oscillospiraceae bacterium]
MRMYDIIEKKKHGEELCRDEIYEMIRLYTEGSIPDYQMSALMMAIYFRGMSATETSFLTDAMATSGDTVDLSALGDRTVDKHSTGGVGDKTTLVVAPIVAAAGGTVAKMSGRGLGHTGGTVDKLESFPGFRTSLSPEEFSDQVKKCGLAVIGQSKDLAPADKKLYALRDVTATVDSIPLIASSIMSKKLAAGTRSIVLDVKCGLGAFMNTPEKARALAEAMVGIGKSRGRQTAAIISNMDIPLGRAVGNSLEVCEAIDVLQGGGPDDLREVALTLASLMLELSLKLDGDEARALALDTLESGRAFEKFCTWIELQGGDASYARDRSKFGKAKYTRELSAEKDGYLASCNAERIGIAAMKLGAGRETKESVIDPRAGIIILKKPGDKVRAGEPVALLMTDTEDKLDGALATAAEAIEISDTPVTDTTLIYEIIR